MSNKSGTSSQIISLPQGGGAQHGIGEKFSPDLHTGTGNFTVPIALPPGRNGFQPQLNLVYSTGNGNGLIGLGWSLSIPGVSRQTSKGIPHYDDVKDTFVLSGAEDLVPVERDAASTRYQPRTEGLFAKILHRQDPGNNYWEVRSKDGLVSLYGTPGEKGNDPAAIAKPTDRNRLFAWKLTRTNDPFGNRIDYLYERDAVQTDGSHSWDQLYLSEIRYADYGSPTNPQFLVKVKFAYETRPDPFSEYRAGFEIRTVRRCTRIEVFTQPSTEVLTRTYRLLYLDQRGLLSEQLPLNGVSLLSQVRVEGHDGIETEPLPPLEFSYTQFEPEGRDFSPIAGPDLPPGSLARPEYELADLFGNGLPDVLVMNGTVRYWRNLGNGKFDRPREMKDAPAGLQLADSGVQMIDADGDGRIDLLVTTPGLSGYFPLRFGGLWDRKSFQRYEVAPSFNLEDPEVKLVDLTGDGVTDAIRSDTRLECFFNNPRKGWAEARWVERQALETFPNINFSDPRVKWGDMSGDGLQDIVLVHDGNIEYWPNLGYGNWGDRISMHNSPRFRYGYDPRRILVGDIDGDGLADIVYVDDKKVILWINRSGNGWSDPIEIKGTPPVSDMDAVRLVDLLGTGIAGVLWSADAGGLSRQNMFFLDFTGGVKPYLLNEMDNHMGSLTRVGYQPSIQFYLEDEKRPETRWKTPLPFPVQVVAKVETIDQISQGKLTTEYRYHHGYWDGAEREFRGFGRVDQRDTQVFEAFNTEGLHQNHPFDSVTAKSFSPPLETRTWFHQGPVGDEFGEWEELDLSHEFWSGDPQVLSRPQSTTDFLKGLPRRAKRDALRTLRGNILRTELYALDGTVRQNYPYTVTEAMQGVRDESPPPAGSDSLSETLRERNPIFFPFPLAQRTTQWERGNEPMTQFSFTEDYDAFGQPQRRTAIACPRGWRSRSVSGGESLSDTPAEPYLATRSRTVYAEPMNPQVHIRDRVAKTTTYEIENTSGKQVQEIATLADDSPNLKMIGQTLNYYDGPEFQGLPYRQIETYGALVRSLTLVLTEEILQDAYGTDRPTYLNNPVNWTAEYPQEFRAQLPILAGYIFQAGGVGSEFAAGYYAITERRSYDFHQPGGEKRGLVKAMRDPLGRDTIVAYDTPYHLLPTQVTDPVGLKTQARYDYRVLQPGEVTDPNGNKTIFAFTPLGLLKTILVQGKQSGEGDRVRPSSRMEYGFLAFENSPLGNRQPIFVRTIRQIHHDTETDVALPKRDETITTVEYSDGFGRLLQTRSQAEDIRFGESIFGDAGLPADQVAANQDAVGRSPCPGDVEPVVVSGWQTYDNKGRVVEKYEPFFACSWEYAKPTVDQMGQKVTMFYDPRGQMIRTVNPDGSEQRVIYGIPVNLDDPEMFAPTPWEAYTYDANDNAGRTHANIAQGYRHHWNTPSSITIDALGRTVETVERNRNKPTNPGDPLPSIEAYRTRSTYDIRGNLLTVMDALARLAFQHVYDLANQPLRIDSIDAGVRRMVLDATGKEIERRDSKGALLLHAYDALNRPIRLWARDGTGQAITLRERLIYGDSPASGLTETQARDANLLGKLYQHFDEAGRVTMTDCDFKGNILEKNRQVVADSAILSVFPTSPNPNWQISAYRVDWDSAAATPLEGKVYQTSIRYDALNRVKTMQYPEAVDGQRKLLRPLYNRAGALERVELDNQPYVERIAYNAKGQRVLIAYGNEILTRYTYDPHTFRLARLRTERYTQPDTLTNHPTGAPLQEFAYQYDLVGNILRIEDRTPESGILNNPEAAGVTDPQLAQLLAAGDALIRQFEYDPLYRLRFASGRECDLPQEPPPWIDEPRCVDLTRTRAYSESYQYDPVGNIQQLQHQVNGNNRNRSFALVNGNNRLNTVTIGQTVYQYTYDANGNLIQENTARHFEWDYADRMRVFRTQTGNAEPSVHAHYLYDASGQRVKKLVRKQGGQVEATVCIDGMFEHHRSIQVSGIQENNTLHVMDNQSRIALIRVGNPFSNDTTPAVKYQLGDYLGSSNVVVDDSSALINREEYTPYGETSFGSFARKRYRFTGKERDEESGLYYHGARYYAPWLSRWIAADPIYLILAREFKTNSINSGFVSDRKAYQEKLDKSKSLYTYGGNNPKKFIDSTGLFAATPTQVLPQSATASPAAREAIPAVLLPPNPLRDPQVNPTPYEKWMNSPQGQAELNRPENYLVSRFKLEAISRRSKELGREVQIDTSTLNSIFERNNLEALYLIKGFRMTGGKIFYSPIVGREFLDPKNPNIKSQKDIQSRLSFLQSLGIEPLPRDVEKTARFRAALSYFSSVLGGLSKGENKRGDALVAASARAQDHPLITSDEVFLKEKVQKFIDVIFAPEPVPVKGKN
jgi:RHS repeat-associated protein